MRGVDVVTVVEAGLLGAPDPEHLAWALSENRVLFTQDVDFLQLHAEGHRHPGIVYAPQGVSVGQIIQGLLLIYQVLDAEEMFGHVELLG